MTSLSKNSSFKSYEFAATFVSGETFSIVKGVDMALVIFSWIITIESDFV